MSGKRVTEKRGKPPKELAKDRDNRVMQARALELRIAGFTWDQVAKEAGYASAPGAHRGVSRALDRIPRANAEKFLEIELERLDRLQRAAYRQAVAGDLKAIEAVLRVMDRRAKYLGLDRNEERMAAAAELSAAVEAERLQLLAHAFFTTLNDLGLSAEQQAVAPEIFNRRMAEVGLSGQSASAPVGELIAGETVDDDDESESGSHD